MLTYCQQRPPVHLAPWVECTWTLTGTADAERETILPDGRMELIVHHGECPRGQARSFLAGQITAPLHRLMEHAQVTAAESRLNGWFLCCLAPRPAALALYPNPGGAVCTSGVRLRPAAASTVLGMPADELTGHFAVLELHAPATLPDPAITHAVELIEQSAGTARMDELTEAANLSPRHFDRRFLAAVGLPPKAFARIVRFQAVLAAYRVQDFPRWADLALQCGFYDQSPLLRNTRRTECGAKLLLALLAVRAAPFALSREFRRFAGEPRSGFFRNPSAWALLMANLSRTEPSAGAYDQDLCDF